MPVRTVVGVEWLRRGCVVCGRGGAPLCPGCERATVPPPGVRVRGVGPVPALFAYEGAGAEIVQALKFRDGRPLVPVLADGLVDLVGADDPFDAVTWAPTSGARRRSRGFDQAELLARAVARRLGVPARATLRRRAGGGGQTTRTAAEREGAVRFGARRPVRRHPEQRRYLVVDDVCTTGATLRAALGALDAATHGPGPRHGVVVVARTP